MGGALGLRAHMGTWATGGRHNVKHGSALGSAFPHLPSLGSILQPKISNKTNSLFTLNYFLIFETLSCLIRFRSVASTTKAHPLKEK